MDEKEQLRRLKGFVNSLLRAYGDGYSNTEFMLDFEELTIAHGISVRETLDIPGYGRCTRRINAEWLKDE